MCVTECVLVCAKVPVSEMNQISRVGMLYPLSTVISPIHNSSYTVTSSNTPNSTTARFSTSQTHLKSIYHNIQYYINQIIHYFPEVLVLLLITFT